MHRRSSGSPVEDDAEDSPLVSRSPTESTAHGPNNNAFETAEKSRSQIAKRGTSFDLRRDNGASTPRSRNSGLWRTPSSSSTSSTTAMATASTETKSSSASFLMPLASQRLPMGTSPESSRFRSSRLRSPWTCSILTALTTLVASVFLFFIVRSFSARQAGEDGCGIPVMSPTFLHMVGFDTEHTRFASKYNLYLYREEGVDFYNQENLGVCCPPLILQLQC